MQLLGVFGGGLWIIPVILFLAAGWSFYRGYRSSKSNSTITTYQGVQDNTGNVPIYQTGGFVFGCIFIVALIAVIFLMAADK